MAPSPSPRPAPPPPETDSIIDGLGEQNDEDEEGAVALPSFSNVEQNGDQGQLPAPPKEEKKPWDKPLTIPEIRKSSTNWSLASDSGLLLYLQEFSQRMIAKTSHLEKEVDGLVNTAKSTNTKVHNTFNDFLMLANTQFIENRVYDDSEEVDASSEKEEKNGKKEPPHSKSREQREAEVIPRVIKALTLGVNVLDTAFEQLDANAGNSDSEDEDANYKSVDPILEPKDLYAHRALPYIIGTPAFMQDDDVGLADLYSDEEEESSSEEEDESDLSESEYAETGSESEDESMAKKGSRSASTAKSGASGDERESDGDLFASEKEGSDSEEGQPTSSKPKANAFTSELAAKVGAAPPSGDTEEQVTKERSVSEVSHSSSKHGKKDGGKKKKKSKKPRSGSQLEKTDDDDNLFGQPEQEEDEDSPFGRKGLFSNSGGGLFDDEEGGLFDEAPSKKQDHIYEDVTEEAEEPRKKKSQSQSGLFDEDENDLFGSSPPRKKEEPTKSSKPVTSTDGGLFADDDDLFGGTETKTETKKKAEKKASVDLFGEDDDDDLFGDKPSSPKESQPKKKLPPGAVSVFGGANPLASRRPPSFSSDDDDADDFEEPPKMESQPKPKTEQTTKTDKKSPEASNGLFGDDEDDDLFSTPREEKDKKPKNRAAESLFDDIEGEGTEDDLFAATAKEPSKKKPVGGVALFGGADLFGGSPPDGMKEQAEEYTPRDAAKKTRSAANTLSIFSDQPDGTDDDLFDDKKDKDSGSTATRGRTKSKSIFADEDVLFGLNEEDPSVDLFGSSSPTSPSKPDSPLSKGSKPAAAAPSAGGLFSDEDDDDLFGSSKPQKEVPKPKKEPAPAAKKKTTSGGGGLFGDEEEDDDLFGGEDKTDGKAPTKDPAKHKKLPGAVSMFGGVDPSSLIKPSPPSQEPPLSSEDTVDGKTSPKSPLHANLPPVTSPKPSKEGDKPKQTRKPHSHPPSGASKIASLQANLSLDPSALMPGAAPPERKEPPVEVGFDVPVSVKPLSSLQKLRPRPTAKRRLPSRRVVQSSQSIYDTVDGAVGGDPLAPVSSPTSSSPPPTSRSPPPASRSPPQWQPVRAPSKKSADLFGNDDLFDSSPSSEDIANKSKAESDLFSDTTDKVADPLSEERHNKPSTVETKVPSVEDEDDLFGERTAERKEKKPRVKASPPDDDDLFEESKKDVPSLDVDVDLFATAPPPQEKGILDDDDLFGELTGAKPKKKPAKTTTLEDDDDDLFAEKPKKKAKGKKVKPDSDLFADTTDIFADLPASKPKGKKAKKETDIFKDTVEEDIFSSRGGSTPTKAKKKAKKKAKPAADSIFDSSAPSIFDDPLNAMKTD